MTTSPLPLLRKATSPMVQVIHQVHVEALLLYWKCEVLWRLVTEIAVGVLKGVQDLSFIFNE